MGNIAKGFLTKIFLFLVWIVGSLIWFAGPAITLYVMAELWSHDGVTIIACWYVVMGFSKKLYKLADENYRRHLTNRKSAGAGARAPAPAKRRWFRL